MHVEPVTHAVRANEVNEVNEVMPADPFAELLAEGVEPKVIGRRVYYRRKLTDKARSILEEHGDTIAATVRAIAAGKTTYLELSQRLAPGFQWPGTLDHVPVFPGRLPFALGVEWRHCATCMRLEPQVRESGWTVMMCTRYDAPTARLNPKGCRCIAYVPRASNTNANTKEKMT